MTSPPVELCVGAVVTTDDHLLMIRRATEPGRGLWSLPGGRVEPGESMREAVVREVAEETGLAVVCESLVGWVERIADTHHYVIMDFGATLISSPDPTPGTDAGEARFVPLWEVAELPLVDGLLEFLSDHGVVATIA